MKIALIADLHGNRPATEALALDLAAQQVDRILCLGDVVGKGPSSDFTFDWAFANCEFILGGNWDFGIGEQLFPPDNFYWEQLGEARLAKLRALPLERELWLSGRRVRLFHGRPIMRELIMAQQDATLIEPFFLDASGARYDVVLYADAHRQAFRTVCGGLFINTGSVGNAMGVPKCCYAIVDCVEGHGPAPFEVRLRQVDYDRAQAMADARAMPEVPRIDTFIREVETGVYSR